MIKCISACDRNELFSPKFGYNNRIRNSKGAMPILENFAFYGICFWILTSVNGGEVIKQSKLDALTGVRAIPGSAYFSLDNPHPRYYLRVYPNNEM
jgi:hypothetical protein